MPLRRKATAAPSAPAASTPAITPHEQRILDIQPNCLLPLDGVLATDGLPRNLAGIALPSGSTYFENREQFCVNRKLVVDGLGTQWRRRLDKTSFIGFSASAGIDGIIMPYGAPPSDLSIGLTLQVDLANNTADGSDGSNTNSWSYFAFIFGLGLTLNRSSGVLYSWGANGDTGQYYELSIRDLWGQGLKLVYNLTVDGSSEIYVDGYRSKTFNWNRSGSPDSRNVNLIAVGGVAIDANQQGRAFAIRDFWYKASRLSQSQVRLIGA